jgi:putative oxidoreductase
VEVATVLIRRLARPMLASIFIKGGIDTLRNPEPRVQMAKPVVAQATEKVGDRLPDQAPTDPNQLVLIDAGVKVGAGVLLALGKLPRASSLLLAASIIPTTYAGHRFWEKSGDDAAADQLQFLKNVSILGGLVLAAVDTEGKPSLGWRGRRAARKLAKQTRGLTGSSSDAGDYAKNAADSLKSAAETAGATVRDATDIAIGRFVA